MLLVATVVMCLFFYQKIIRQGVVCTGGDNKATHKPEDKDPQELESVNITQEPLTVSGTCEQAT